MSSDEKFGRGRRVSSVDGEFRDTHVSIRLKASLVKELEIFAMMNKLTKTDVIELGLMCLLSGSNLNVQSIIQRYMATRNINRKV